SCFGWAGVRASRWPSKRCTETRKRTGSPGHAARQDPHRRRPLRRGPHRQGIRRRPSRPDEHASRAARRLLPTDLRIAEEPVSAHAFVRRVHYTDDLIILDVSFIQGRPKETRLALLKDINARVAAAADGSPDDMLITLYEVPGENISFGQGEAQRANAVARA